MSRFLKCDAILIRTFRLIAPALLLGMAAPVLADVPPPPTPVAPAVQPKATLQDLAWITGHWKGESHGSAYEETWSAPLGDNMVGTFRFIQDGKAGFYEFMALETEPEGPVLRLRHFNRGLTAWEEKDASPTWKLVRFGRDEFVFEQQGGKQARLTYRKEGEQGLLIRLEHVRGGRPATDDFRFTRAR